jgi:hypothetical protein
VKINDKMVFVVRYYSDNYDDDIYGGVYCDSMLFPCLHYPHASVTTTLHYVPLLERGGEAMEMG